jgi:hypothetical protein
MYNEMVRNVIFVLLAQLLVTTALTVLRMHHIYGPSIRWLPSPCVPVMY